MYNNVHVQYKNLMKAITELMFDIYNEDDAKLKVILGTTLFEDPIVEEVIYCLENNDCEPDDYYQPYVIAVLESLLDCYFEAIFNKSLYEMVDVQDFRFCGSDVIDLMLEAFGVIGEEEVS